MTKRILVACGTALATSTIVAKEIEELCKENKLSCVVIQCKADEALTKARTFRPDVIVSTVELKGETTVPVINAMGFLTGINVIETRNELLDILRK